MTAETTNNLNFDLQRNLAIAKDRVRKLKLDLTGLTVATECASSAYAFTSVLAALAGARVVAVGRNSRYGSFADNKSQTKLLLRELELLNQVQFYEGALPDEKWGAVDIVTNSGFLRPIDESKVSKLKNTAVICLMWETWEFRQGEIDIAACQKQHIPVIGTDEHFVDADMFPYLGMLALKLLFELQLEVVNNKLVLLGEGLTGDLIAKTFQALNLDFDWFKTNPIDGNGRCFPYSDLPRILEHERLDGILCADHVTKEELIGANGNLTFKAIANKFPFVKYGHICGNIDAEELAVSGLTHCPERIMPVGYMSYETVTLGWEPVILLNSAGLKVGELAARKRLVGKSVTEAIQTTVQHGIGMDFPGGFYNYMINKNE